MAELGQTNDPRALVPGDVRAVTQTVSALQAYGDVLVEAGEGLARIDTRQGWSGEAADRFRKRFHGEPGRWTEAGGCFHAAARELANHASTLGWAQREAGAAIELWNQGQAATTIAKAAHDRKVRAASQAGKGTNIPFLDPGEAKRQAARNRLQAARTRLHSEGQTAAEAIGRARDKAPDKPGFWSKVGHFFEDVGRDLENVGIDAVNELASIGNAAVQHPGDVGAMIGGGLLAGVSAGGEGIGAALDITGIGAVAGVPLNVVSAGGIALGGAIGVAGAGDLLNHAGSDSQVSLMQANSESSGTGGSAQQSASELLKNGQEFKGTGGRAGNKLPLQGGPSNGVLYKTDPQTGNVTNYATYDADGRVVKRVDVTGASHGGIDTPHVVEYARDTNPAGQTFVRKLPTRAAFPWEVP